MSRNLANVETASYTFYSWINRTNDILDVLKETVTVKANTAGDMTSGNGFVNGHFGANTVMATTLRGGNVQSNAVLTISSNTNLGNSTISVTTLHNNVTHIKSSSHTSTNTDPQIVDSFGATEFRAGKYLISIRDTDNSDYQSTEIMLLHDATNAYVTEYATLVSNNTLGTFVANIDSSVVRLYITPTNINNVIKYHRTMITV